MELDLKESINDLTVKLPSTSGKAKVDLLNTIVDLYQIWDDDNQMQVDQACPFATQAFNEAKKINYKRGLGYAILKLAYCELLRAGIHKAKNKFVETSSITTIEGQVSQSLKISKEIKDQVMTGSTYVLMGRLEGLKGNKEKHISYLKTGIEIIEKYAPLQSKKAYREQIYTGSCDSCDGYEFRLAELYSTLNFFQPNKSDDFEYTRKALSYYERSGAKTVMAIIYERIGQSTVFTNLRASIQNFKLAASLAEQDKNEELEMRLNLKLCAMYWNSGDFENGLVYSKKSARLAEKLLKQKHTPGNKNQDLGLANYWMGRFYLIGGDYETAMWFIKKAYSFFPSPLLVAELGEIHRTMGNYDSAMYYLSSFADKKDALPITKKYLSNLYISLGEYDKALPFNEESIEIEKKNNNLSNLGSSYTNAALISIGKKDLQKALDYSRTSVELLTKTNKNIRLIESLLVFSDIFNRLGRYDSAFIYLKKYTALKDSLINRQSIIKLNDFKNELEEEKRSGQIRILQKDNQIKAQQLQEQLLLQQKGTAQLALLYKDTKIKDQQLLIKDQEIYIKEQQLKEQLLLKERNVSQLKLLDNENKLQTQKLRQQTTLRNALLGGLFAFFAIAIFSFRYIVLKQNNERLKHEKKQAELQQQTAELEMQALRAQMNPHFIFNCLSSINKFILKNESREASDYLTRFSRLIRTVLTNSQLSKIPLSDEIEMLRLYLEMERLRFSNSFDYSIIFENAIEPESVYIPPLILQPICENAIWHGLMHKESHGTLTVRLTSSNKWIECIITDNGVGRKKAAELRSKKSNHEKSFGVKITTERLALFNQHQPGSYEVTDLYDEAGNATGTSVRLLINIHSPNTVREIQVG